MKPKLSVIVTTRNSAAHIETCLQSIRNQSLQPHEVIVVDNDSKDKTKLLAKKYTELVFNHGPERSAQRNYGAKKATGTHLVFLDSDMELTTGVVEEIIDTCAKDLDALYIPEVIAGSSWWSQIRSFERGFYNSTVIDAVRAVSKVLFNKVGGFDENLTGPEDWDFDKQIRIYTKNIAIITQPLIHHEERVTLRSYLTKKGYYAQDFEKYKSKWGHDDLDIQKQFGFWYRYVGVFTEKGKWKKLLSNPFLAISMMGIRFLVGVSYIKGNVLKS